MSGYVYILESAQLPGWCKVGKTTRSVEKRCAELSTGVPGGLQVNSYFCVADPDEQERLAHRTLAAYRGHYERNDEWFNISAKRARDILGTTVSEAGSDFSPNGTRETIVKNAKDIFTGSIILLGIIYFLSQL